MESSGSNPQQAKVPQGALLLAPTQWEPAPARGALTLGVSMVASLIPEKKSKLPKIEVYAVRLDRQGYDRHGRYFGVGEKLWNWYDDRGYGRDEYIRAPTKSEAVRQFREKLKIPRYTVEEWRQRMP